MRSPYSHAVDWDQLRWSCELSLNPVSTELGQVNASDCLLAVVLAPALALTQEMSRVGENLQQVLGLRLQIGARRLAGIQSAAQ